MPGPAGVIAASDLALLPVVARSKDDRRPEGSGRDRPASQPQGGHPQKPIGQGLPVFAAEIWCPNLALLDPACPPCRWGLRPPAVPSEHMRVRPDPRAGLVDGTPRTGGSPGGEGGRAASLRAAGEADSKAA